ncbi:hypothetical protein J7L06_01560 [Candidatus Bathyarchaeota archaeon]|nr:hypothetical protein [Candidatus Bathyarchaeota archaeon]
MAELSKIIDGGDTRRGMKFLGSLRSVLKRAKAGSSFRRFFINTLFDSTFMLLGIVVGSALTPASNVRVVLSTMIASSLALGISTGVSVYEAESLEWRLKLDEIEKAMLTDLENTGFAQLGKRAVVLIAILNFLTPLLSCGVTIIPFLMTLGGFIGVNCAGYVSALLALSTLFLSGAYIGKKSKMNPWVKGLRMVVLGIMAFISGILIRLVVNLI